MSELEIMERRINGIAELSPEQTVAVLRCFMNDEGAWMTAKRTGITLSEAEQCTADLWNIFSYRKEICSRN